ncbi:hypothetical protein SK3146_01945 [Paenibacillus konkukensis]|uniref:DUF4044 domain-containing protein n=1 Tax=Paenibacillus konkukensis TaxID=2020716 RepID=A0ABY4RKU5_9BACL|nr:MULTISPECIES: hypothetical protein [Paenibacillus]UQZ82785.1 hypothetical protein SK3146_01945 [Paenibacillus konkukensis]
MHRKKPTYLQQRKPQETVNKKAIIWVGSIFVALIVVMAVLLVFNK